ncbi:MAG: site-specific integrase [Lachnospiraceae bacterium]|nr:site-specific integrase [Lachnospiraceae bacterium]
MPRKGENIFKRKDGRWEARYIKGYDVSGKAKYGFCYGKTYTEARSRVAILKSSNVEGNENRKAKSKQNFSYYCDRWLEQHKTMIKPSTYAKYSSILESYIKPQLGNYHLCVLSTELVEKFKVELLIERNLSAKSVRDILTVLKQCFTFTKRQIQGEMPDIEIIYPREQKKEIRVLTRDEQEQLVEYLFSDMDLCKFGVYLALTTGLRIGELCALRWSDISIQNRTIKISSTMQRVKNFDDTREGKTMICIGSPKSDSSSRTIPLIDSTVALCRQFVTINTAAFVLTGTTSYMEPRTLQYRFKRYVEHCGLVGVHFHTLRHTFATRCVEVGFEVKSLSEILGHANTSITLNRYVHSSMELKRSNMNKLTTVGF